MHNDIGHKSPCRSCKNMACRSRRRDCYGIHESSLAAYTGDAETGALANSASALIDNGRAGTINRVQEVVAFCLDRKFVKIGVAYCFGMKSLAMEFCEILESHGMIALPVSCTSGAVKESELDSRKNTEAVSCNPAGQAMVLDKMSPDFVVEMGLCLGHDVIFHQQLNLPFTVLVVKDRVLAHNSAAALSAHRDANTAFLEALDDHFAMKPPEWLHHHIQSEMPTTIVDLRPSAAFVAAHIPTSINIELKELVTNLHMLQRDNHIVCVCNGSVQSAYAIMFLYSRGFSHVYNLSGGFSRWQREGYGVETS